MSRGQYQLLRSHTVYNAHCYGTRHDRVTTPGIGFVSDYTAPIRIKSALRYATRQYSLSKFTVTTSDYTQFGLQGQPATTSTIHHSRPRSTTGQSHTGTTATTNINGHGHGNTDCDCPSWLLTTRGPRKLMAECQWRPPLISDKLV